MESLVKCRRVYRTAFTKNAKQLEQLMSEEQLNLQEIEVQWLVLKEKEKTLKEQDNSIQELILKSEYKEEELTQELNSCETYNVAFAKLTIACNNLLYKKREPIRVADKSGEDNGQQKYKLPKIEFKKFTGDVKEWLAFWAQFKKIHLDSNLDAEDKFQYLLQATLQGSRARELVESFPPTNENYQKAIDSLKARFGQDDMLVEVYVRELLKIVLNNAMNGNVKVSLDTLYDRIETKLRALETLGVTTDKCAAMLYPLVESCLPEDILRAWQRSSDSSTVESKTLKNRLIGLMNFVKSEVENEARISLAAEGFGLNSSDSASANRKKKSVVNSSVPTALGLLSGTIKCIFCDKAHRSEECYKARKMSLEEKRKIMADKKLCFRCLKIGHLSRKCRERVSCVVCNGQHFTVLCPDIPINRTTNKTSSKTADNTNEDAQDTVLSNYTDTRVFLQTLRVKVMSEDSEREVRAIIDTGSQRSYILSDLAMKLGYRVKSTEEITHALFGGVASERQQHFCYEIRLANLDGSYRCRFDVLSQKTICSSLSHITKGKWMEELKARKIDISDNLPGPIEVLIGSDVAGKLFSGNNITLNCGLVAVHTCLGWTVMGKVPCHNVSRSTTMNVTTLFCKDMPLTDLWNLDVLGITDPTERRSRQQLEEAAQQHFLETVTVSEGGRYQVDLPWLEQHPVLPNNFQLARKRLQGTMKNLKSDGILDEYEKIFVDWQEEGIIEEVEAPYNNAREHYLPHRAVIKEESTTTKIRPVFDASAREKNQPSLNHCLEKGPNLIELIPKILLKFRFGKIGVVSDIRKAFLQIEVQEKDRDFLRFLWMTSDGQLKVFRHRRVVFGVCCSPFLLGATLNFHLRKILESCEAGKSTFSKAIIQKLLDSFYVDNCVTSVNDTKELNELIEQSSEALKLAAFDLRGWASTQREVQDEKLETPVLGLSWERVTDTISVSPTRRFSPFPEKVTKRYILSEMQQIFDPIGFTCPTTLRPKLMLQELWTRKVGWDEEVDETTQENFRKWFEEARELPLIALPRWINLQTMQNEHRSLHVFCDASGQAYAAAIFLRVEDAGNVRVTLLKAKTRVAPIKQLSIPRLELLAATIGARLYREIKDSFGDINLETHFWSDSSTVINWIKREEEWAVFVGNRIKEIRELTDRDRWKHIPGVKNPADLPSRGCSPKALIQSRWWEGPIWLQHSSEHWPNSEGDVNEKEINQEKKKCVVSSVATVKEEPWYGRYFSKYPSIVRHIAWICRFAHNARPSNQRRSGELSAHETLEAEKHIFKLIQKEAIDLNNKKIRHLNPYTDDEGVIRVKTRLQSRSDLYDFRCPVLLPATHCVVERLILYEHKKACHAGTQLLMNILRERFWILGGRRSVRRVVSRCVICRRHEIKHLETVSSSLPNDRVKSAAAFQVTGIDFAGPLYLKNNKKTWICLFTCGVYRAVHLELVSNLSTDGFLQALRRFISRRGRPQVVYTDNGTNFVGANNLLSTIDWKEVEKFSSTTRMQWKFNPPSAPWWGGWWERMVRLIKQLLRRVLGSSSLSYEELQTVLCDCEAVINSRPLTYLSNNPDDPTPLSPKMFLRDYAEDGVEDCDQVDQMNLQRRVQYRQEISKHLRQRFRSEYLGQLRQISRKKSTRAISVGDIMFIGDDNRKRLDWPLGRVVEILPGKDGEVRLAKLQVASGHQLLRPVQRLYPLECAEDLHSAPVPSTAKAAEDNDKEEEKSVREILASVSDSDSACDTMACQSEKVRVTSRGRVIKTPTRLLV